MFSVFHWDLSSRGGTISQGIPKGQLVKMSGFFQNVVLSCVFVSVYSRCIAVVTEINMWVVHLLPHTCTMQGFIPINSGSSCYFPLCLGLEDIHAWTSAEAKWLCRDGHLPEENFTRTGLLVSWLLQGTCILCSKLPKKTDALVADLFSSACAT